MIFPLIIVGLGGCAAYAVSRRKPAMTDDRRRVFEEALTTLKDPVQLRVLAKSFDEAGLKAEAELLEKRAKLRELPKEIKKARKDALKKALSSKDADGVRKVADAFYGEGATGAAALLYEYEKSLREGADL